MISTSPVETGLAPVNGLQLYYEIRGTGAPLILLHGGLGSIEMFGPNVDALAAHRRVIGVDLQGHGRTADIDRPLACDLLGDDIAALIDHLKLGAADVMGYSLGSGVAIQTAMRHRDRVRRLVVVSGAFARNGWFPEVLAAGAHVGPQLAEMMRPSPVYQLYARIAPRPDDFATLLGKTGELLRRDFDWMPQVAALPPTLIIAGDADAIRPAHLLEVYAQLGGGLRDPGWDGAAGRSTSQLAILPGTTHYDIVTSPAIVTLADAFLPR